MAIADGTCVVLETEIQDTEDPIATPIGIVVTAIGDMSINIVIEGMNTGMVIDTWLLSANTQGQDPQDP